MGEGLLAERQGGRPLPEIVAGNDGTIGSDFSEQVVPLLSCGWWKCSGFSGLIGGGLYRGPGSGQAALAQEWSFSGLIGGGLYRGPQSSFCIVQPGFYGRVRS